ncbi:DUF1661 domain-containing protein [Porphyromonas gingivalis]
MARKFFVSRTKTEKISRVFSRIYEPLTCTEKS